MKFARFPRQGEPDCPIKTYGCLPSFFWRHPLYLLYFPFLATAFGELPRLFLGLETPQLKTDFSLNDPDCFSFL